MQRLVEIISKMISKEPKLDFNIGMPKEYIQASKGNKIVHAQFQDTETGKWYQLRIDEIPEEQAKDLKSMLDAFHAGLY